MFISIFSSSRLLIVGATFSLLIIGAALFTLRVSGTSEAQGAQQVPESIAGYEVIMVKTPDNTACFGKATGRRILLKVPDPMVDEFLSKSATRMADIQQALRDLDLLEGTTIGFAGPGTTKEEVEQEHKKWNDFWRGKKCTGLGGPITPPTSNAPARSGPSSTHLGRGFALVVDVDASSFTDDNAQSVRLRAPNGGATPPGRFVAFLNNTMTNTDWFVQSGFFLESIFKSVIWTDEQHSLTPQSFDIPYTPGHTYWFSNTYTSGWWLCGQDLNVGTYRCFQSPWTGGTTMNGGNNTSVWIGTNSTIPWWEDGFDAFWYATVADIYRNGSPFAWSFDLPKLYDGCDVERSATGVISGSLVNHMTASFKVSGVPLATCP